MGIRKEIKLNLDWDLGMWLERGENRWRVSKTIYATAAVVGGLSVIWLAIITRALAGIWATLERIAEKK